MLNVYPSVSKSNYIIGFYEVAVYEFDVKVRKFKMADQTYLTSTSSFLEN